ncbi:hypothetical protein CVT25_005105 [Psilocybe cyanescens]|uniref:Uncharacterized protein n=1 Tax=Psilocybe cyanescens TaxID=93625 RepID=A0A409XE17_PSICY|nr:hypothetical protein CVT25_005105 [Psilocybe cyanescens]
MPRLPLVDILHRGVVYSLAGLTVYGVVMSVLIHRDTIRRGEDYGRKTGVGVTIDQTEEGEEIEQTLAEQAQAIFRNRRSS